MKNREDRHGVLIPARIRWRGQWEVASIRNVSSRGMMLRLNSAPPPGSYVEIDFASNIIAARSVWSDGQACGFRLQDLLDIARLRSGQGLRRAAPRAEQAASAYARRPTEQEQSDRSRRLASAFQFVTLVVIGLGAAVFAASEVYSLLSAPLNAVSHSLT